FCQACGKEVTPAVAVTSAQVATADAGFPHVDSPVAPTYPAAEPSYPYAGFWERFAAYLIDGLILSIPFGFLVFTAIFLLGGFGAILHRRQPIDPGEAAAFVGPMFMFFILGMIVFIALQWLYSAGMESSERQGTIGKVVMSLRVTDYEGRRI